MEETDEMKRTKRGSDFLGGIGGIGGSRVVAM